MAREGYTLVCTVCKMENYISKKNKKTHPEKIELNKFCAKCGAHTAHREKK
ncbi:50S ribosomal protein L33 [Mycoplasma sp. CSL10137]|uniref:50S ribosomal protein L33 n=1 Tax=unclassified Mycoplasma TaxID=2683645 RepID=UPI0015832A42|nr:MULTISPECIES: 50S ribosomal protein L33 [unclassified Mycoplasma]MBN4083457.1 50S ribosomal protein L33 [Mycoplasma sp. CSL10137]MBN4084612.1 50S ribosomal protein L33 [Mycoplasma sp. CSL10166]MBU4693090.1 50S ribosomal protein L33 [Mycoplasma sp. CSL7491-lung]MCU4706509.1 50S ribosomal protein L33 [Mycoplasma sp. CSL7503-lung]QKT05216.1 50S ribosomal protein L33 [Mycoplasma sp. OR1901]